MSDEGDKICHLCAEEMDLTDQQLKPCKCGYEICLWCWHKIINESEGLCPACRTAYNKEKILGDGSNSGSLQYVQKRARKKSGVAGVEVAEEEKIEGTNYWLYAGSAAAVVLLVLITVAYLACTHQSKNSERRMHLGSVQVIQRNLVYVAGLPLSFAEDNFQRCRDYFGQHGKVLKVSVPRTATGAIQHFANSTCSIYITYSKEEEAIQCIQSVHGSILDDKPLTECFGTTKYWLRNMTCRNPDCFYLHKFCLEEDSNSSALTSMDAKNLQLISVIIHRTIKSLY